MNLKSDSGVAALVTVGFAVLATLGVAFSQCTPSTQVKVEDASVKLCDTIAGIRALERATGTLPAAGTARADLETNEDKICAALPSKKTGQ